jgi:hypothetical protein
MSLKGALQVSEADDRKRSFPRAFSETDEDVGLELVFPHTRRSTFKHRSHPRFPCPLPFSDRRDLAPLDLRA